MGVNFWTLLAHDIVLSTIFIYFFIKLRRESFCKGTTLFYLIQKQLDYLIGMVERIERPVKAKNDEK